jgi:hypothetical protein
MPVRGLIRIAIILAVVGVALTVLGLLIPGLANFLLYIYIALVFGMALYAVLTYLPRRAISFVTRAAIVGIMLGLAGMIQPFVFELFRAGFYLLLASTVTYTVVSYVRTPAASSAAASHELLEDMPVSLIAADSTIPNSGGS